MREHRRIAMWSGPRNISTALMRAWGNRSDTFVCDEPLYAHYLLKTGVDHPGREEVIAHHETDWRKVIQWLTGDPLQLPAAATGLTPDVIAGRTMFYQKHMAHHLLPEIERGWLDSLTHAFLIRDPREMLPSLLAKFPRASLDDTGLPQQVAIFEEVRRRVGQTPPVIDARDVLLDPRAVLTELCNRLGVPFDEAMLHWPAGRRPTDGIWAKYWYDAVERTSGFEPYKNKQEKVGPEHAELLKQCLELYDQLAEHRLSATVS